MSTFDEFGDGPLSSIFTLDDGLHGRGEVISRWDPTSRFLATCGSNNTVHIFTRDGQNVFAFSLTGKSCLDMQWDKDGETLAVMQSGSAEIALWSINEPNGEKMLDTNMRDPSFIRWSRVDKQLAIGTVKGNLLLYDANTMKKRPHMGRHPKKILCGAWSLENTLAMASEDRLLTISDSEGKLLDQTQFQKSVPVYLVFAEQKKDEKQKTKENTVCVNMGQRSLILSNVNMSLENPVELQFQHDYGEIKKFTWFGDGYIMIGFTKGWVVAISTHIKEIGGELNRVRAHENELYDIAYSKELNKFASCGDDGLHVFDMSDWKEQNSLFKRFSKHEGTPISLQWTGDGQILTCVTDAGYCFNFLMSIPVISSGNGSKMSYLSSLRTVHVSDCSDNYAPVKIDVAIEPGFMAIGSTYLAVGMNSNAWFYKFTDNKVIQVRDITYLNTVDKMCVNSTYSAALCDGKCHLYRIRPTSEQKMDYKGFPDDKDTSRVTDISLTDNFLIYTTENGSLHYFYIKDWAPVNLFHHECGIRLISPNPQGTRVVFIDAKNKGYLYCPVDDSCVPIPALPVTVESIIWDSCDFNVFIAVDVKAHRKIGTYFYRSQSIKGPQVSFISNTDVPSGLKVLVFYDGVIYGQKNSGSRTQIILRSHTHLPRKNTLIKPDYSGDKGKQALFELVSLGRLTQAWNIATLLKSKDYLLTVGKKAMELLQVDFAIRIFRQLENTAMVLALEEIQNIEDINLLAGHICLLNSQYSQAQSLFLNSSKPIAALQMRRDLMNWEQALKLAQNLAPEQIPFICREYAQQLEVKGEYTKALNLYERAISELSMIDNINNIDKNIIISHERQSNGGIARMTMRLGRLQQGRQLAMKSNDKHLLRECASILNSLSQYDEAAEMYVAAEQFEKAATIYISTKNFKKVQPLMDLITTPKLHAAYAKAKEAEKDYSAAAIAYEKAKDMVSVIRINLFYLDNPERAFQMVRETKNADGAAMVATYCQEKGHFQSAIEFLLMAKCADEAYKLAETKDQMDKYAIVLENSDLATSEEYMSIAIYFEEKRRWEEAARYYSKCGNYIKAVKYYLQCKDDKIMDAIEVVKLAGDGNNSNLQDQLGQIVHSWIIGEGDDGKVKDSKYLFELCRATGDYEEMEATAIDMAQQEQSLGEYQAAHKMLLQTYLDLSRRKINISNELKRNLRLLHSYLLAKRLGQLNDFENSARMLLRAAENISKFPMHVVKILTSTIVVCQRAGMKRSSYEYAVILMQPEYRNNVDEKVRKRIEALVRRPQKTEIEEAASPCPYCDFLLPDTCLDCPQCKNDIPYCIATGKHMLVKDWCHCPSCNMPALYTPFVKQISELKTCPMCREIIQLSDITKLDTIDAKRVLISKPVEEDNDDNQNNDDNGDDYDDDDDGDEELDEEEFYATRQGPRKMF